MPAPDILKDLVKRFDEHREAYRSGKYNETQVHGMIDRVMCELYGLSEDEIKIVES